MRFAGAVVLACLLTASAEAQPVVCVAGAPACTVPAGTYHVALPAHGSAHPPAVMFLHGLGGSGEGVLANRTMTDALTARGFAVIAPDGLRTLVEGYRRSDFDALP